MTRINILYCIDYLNHGGTEKQLISLINGLDRTIFQPHLCCLRQSVVGDSRKRSSLKLFQMMECPKIHLDFISFKNLKSLWEIYKLICFIKTHNINILQSFFQDPALIGFLAGKIAGTNNFITSFRDLGFWREDESDLKMKMIYNKFPNYLANSNAVKNYYINHYGLQTDRFDIIYNGIEIGKFTPINQRKQPGSKIPIVGIVANLNREVKRVDIFLMAAAYVLRQNYNVRFIIAGEGELKEKLIKLCDELGIQWAVQFLGMVEDIPRLLCNIDIGVLASDSEGFSNSILEYMAAGVPVVATDVGGNNECIIHGLTGYLVPRGDHCAMGESIINLLSDNEAYNKIQQSAYSSVCERFSIQQCITDHQDYYKKIYYGGKELLWQV